ncbi:MAG: beta-lactamase family protein [Herminiimonas sp.]|nr:beta-lactamase family protein [Herminiimonas sp.]
MHATFDIHDATPPPDATGARAAFDQRGLSRLAGAIEAHVATGRIPGATLLLSRHGQEFEQAFGRQNPQAPLPMSTNSIFRIYSMTKPVVSVAVMMLAEQGKLLISEPVSNFLPEFKGLQVGVERVGADGKPQLDLVPCTNEMTVQDLLRHTAGLTYGIFGASTLVKAAYRDSGVESRHVSNDALVAKLGQLPLAFQPGTVWEYSRATDVLGALLERLSGQTLDRYLQEQIFAPLGMVDTGFWVDPAQQHRIAEPYEVDPVTGNKVRLIDVTQRPMFLSGGGGLVSTARDYLRFARMLLNRGELDGVRLLSRKTLAFMTADHLGAMPDAMRGAMYLPGPGYGFGLGFAVRLSEGGPFTPGSAGDYNWSGLAGTYFWIDPKEDLIAIWLMQAPEQRDYYRQLIRNVAAGWLN